jgi:DNA gyrase subunit A
MSCATDDDFLLVVTGRGYGKRTPISAYPVHRRGGGGVITARIVEERGGLAGALVVPFEAELLLVTDAGTVIRMDLADVRPMGRATQGVALMRADDDATVVGLARVVDESVERSSPRVGDASSVVASAAQDGATDDAIDGDPGPDDLDDAEGDPGDDLDDGDTTDD